MHALLACSPTHIRRLPSVCLSSNANVQVEHLCLSILACTEANFLSTKLYRECASCLRNVLKHTGILGGAGAFSQDFQVCPSAQLLAVAHQHDAPAELFSFFRPLHSFLKPPTGLLLPLPLR